MFLFCINSILEAESNGQVLQSSGRYTEEFILELQQELVKARLREAEATVQLNETHERIQQVEFENRLVERSPHNSNSF